MPAVPRFLCARLALKVTPNLADKCLSRLEPVNREAIAPAGVR